MENGKFAGFVIYGAMRTGSNYLVSLFNQFDGMVCHGEAFNPGFVGLREDYFEKFGMKREEPANRDADLNGFYERLLERDNPTTLCGFKLFPGHSPVILGQTLADPKLGKIILQRDVLTSFISLCQAEASGVWIIKDGNQTSRSKSQERSDVKVTFDGPRFLRYREQVKAFYRQVEETLQNNGQAFLRLWYRDLNTPATVQALAEFLKCSPPSKLNTRELLVKQNLSAPHERVSNLREMVEFLDLHRYRSDVVKAARQASAPTGEEGLRVNGVRINPDNPALSPSMRARICSANYEVHEARCVTTLVEPEEIVLELGGGIGYISSLVWNTGRASQIVVVEANPDTIPVIQETHTLNNVKALVLNGVAMPDCGKESFIPFYVRSDFWASSLYPEPWGYSREVSVPCLDFKALLATHQPSLLICDIEGGEANLLGSIPCMPSVQKIVLELHQDVTGAEGIRDIFLNLSKQGFAYDPLLSQRGVVVFRRLNKPTANTEPIITTV